MRDYCPPIMYPATSSTLYRNEGNGSFSDVTRAAGLGDAPGKGLGVLFVDVDQDRRPDIFVANDEVMNRLFRNLGGGRFEDVSVVSGTAFGLQGNPQGGMGVDSGDLDGDGLVDIVVANFENENDSFFRNLGEGTFDDLSISSGFGPPTLGFVKFGIVLLDVENDGDLDAHVVNGHIYEKPRRQGSTAEQRAQLLWNDGTGHFVERSCGPAFEKASIGRGSAVADFDNDGDPDVAVSSSNGALQLLRNDGAHGQLARRGARRDEVQPPGNRRQARRRDSGGEEAHAMGGGGLQLPLELGPARDLRPRRREVGADADGVLAVGDRADDDGRPRGELHHREGDRVSSKQ